MEENEKRERGRVEKFNEEIRNQVRVGRGRGKDESEQEEKGV